MEKGGIVDDYSFETMNLIMMFFNGARNAQSPTLKQAGMSEKLEMTFKLQGIDKNVLNVVYDEYY